MDLGFVKTVLPLLRDTAFSVPGSKGTATYMCRSSPVSFLPNRFTVQEQFHLIGMVIISPNINRFAAASSNAEYVQHGFVVHSLWYM
jgi:hypothetical protein